MYKELKNLLIFTMVKILPVRYWFLKFRRPDHRGVSLGCARLEPTPRHFYDCYRLTVLSCGYLDPIYRWKISSWYRISLNSDEVMTLLVAQNCHRLCSGLSSMYFFSRTETMQGIVECQKTRTRRILWCLSLTIVLFHWFREFSILFLRFGIGNVLSNHFSCEF